VNNYATFACRAGDADTYRRLRKQIGDRRYDEAWPSNLNMEVCDERLTKPI
jgi:Tfp pilus assembly protein PilF